MFGGVTNHGWRSTFRNWASETGVGHYVANAASLTL